MLKIDKGIHYERYNRTPMGDELRETVRACESGDSFTVANAKTAQWALIISQRLGKRGHFHKIDKTGICRVWVFDVDKDPWVVEAGRPPESSDS